MQVTPANFLTIHNPGPDIIGENPILFLQNLGSPAWITIDGEDTSRQRTIVTLLHGNEPSGLKAIHRLLKQRIKPATNVGIFIASVNAALHPPYLSHRYLPDERDLNRCFGVYSDDASNQEKLASALVKTLNRYQPEAIIDTHNTSANSVPFAVAISATENFKQLTSIFTSRLIVLDQQLGTLIEQPVGCPVVTVEFGAFADPDADKLAYDCLYQFLTQEQLYVGETNQLQTLVHPLRLEIDEDVALHYSASVQDSNATTIFNTIDQLNFQRIEAGTSLGWPGPDGLKPFRVRDSKGNDLCQKLFSSQSGFIETRVPMTIFMATTDPFIAKKDCLMYLCPEY